MLTFHRQHKLLQVTVTRRNTNHNLKFAWLDNKLLVNVVNALFGTVTSIISSSKACIVEGAREEPGNAGSCPSSGPTHQS
jgi:hypothetical protein